MNSIPENLPQAPRLLKAGTGIDGLDAVTNGGLPKGRPTLVCGEAGCGKTLLAMQFLVRGASEYDEPGVFMAFEETADDLAENVSSLGVDLRAMIDRKQLVIEYVHIDPHEIEETGEYDLEGLFVRLGYAIDSVGARRVVLDTIENLFDGLSNTRILRSELRRLFRWLKDRGVTAIVTAERGEKSLTRLSLEEYVSDCVIVLDHRVADQISTRRLRIVKYRGSTHGTNEFPFLIDESGISVVPITSAGQLQHEASDERVSSGIPRLDSLLGGTGFFRGSTVLISGTAGTGKTSFATHFAAASARHGERAIYFAFEESPSQLIRNMKSIGLDLTPFVKQGLLVVHSARPSLYGLETHLARMHKFIRDVQPKAVLIDPISDFMGAGTTLETKSMLVRMIDFLKAQGITGVFTSLTSADHNLADSEAGISSLIDTWLILRELELNGERNRGMYVLKSRGMSHSHQIHQFRLTDRGVELDEADLRLNDAREAVLNQS